MGLKTTLYNWHLKNNAKMVEYAGWDMPINYTSVIDEHVNVRSKAGLFDVSHMGRIRVKGPDRLKFVNYISTADVETAHEFKVLYGYLCNPHGGIIDDITIYKAEEYIMIVCNASNKDKVLSWIIQNKSAFNVVIEDETQALNLIAIQGPLSQTILQEICSINLSDIKYYNFNIGTVANARSLISRTGYTGEDGFEIFAGMLYTTSIWEKLMQVGMSKGIMPIGLGARDSLRAEACLPLYGHEMDEYTTPVDIGFERFVKFQKQDFIGKKPLLHSTSSEFSKRLIAFELTERGVPRQGFDIHFNEMLVGKVTTGIFSPTLQKGCGMGFVDQEIARIGNKIEIVSDKRKFPAVISNRPLYKRRK